jgi:hypothetical protein
MSFVRRYSVKIGLRFYLEEVYGREKEKRKRGVVYT